jgi:hypothetical protein
MALSLENESDNEVFDDRRPSWFGLRLGVPIAVILIGIALATLWDLKVHVLASADVQLGNQSFRLQLKDDQGWLSACAQSSQGCVFVQRLAALETNEARGPGAPRLSKHEVRNARVFIDRERQTAQFVLERATIVFDGRRFSLSELRQPGAPQANP